jgi:UDP-glucose 4-epimerase
MPNTKSKKKPAYELKNSVVAVTGGCGFIGSHLIDELLERGVKKIIAIDSLEYGKTENIPLSDPRIQFIKHKLGADDALLLKKHLEGVDFLFHLAAEKHNQSKDSPEKVIQANITGMHQLLAAAVANNVKKVIFSSSLYAYGRMSKPKYKETDVILPQTVYGMTKASGEYLLKYFNRQFGLEYNVLRYLFAYGPRQYSNLGYKSVIVSNFNKIYNGENPTIYGDGKQALDYIYVSDLVDGTILAMTTPLSGEIFNIGSGIATTIQSLTRVMLKAAKSKLTPVYTAADWTAGTFRVGDVSKAKRMLGFKAKTPLEKGLTETYNSLKQTRHS